MMINNHQVDNLALSSIKIENCRLKTGCNNKGSYLSPLRYPGGKRRLADYVREVLILNELRPKLFIEPFAGGASVSLYLLINDYVDNIALGELDPLVASFWKIVFMEPEWLIEHIENQEVTLNQWKKFKKDKQRNDKERAMACLFLNRTNFSGIMNPGAGPIGGMDQQSAYKIGCRFPKENIIKRIRLLSHYKNRVKFVREGHWADTMNVACSLPEYKAEELFFYLDPPFYHKASILYSYSFDYWGHVALCRHLSKVKSPWLVSYDPAEEIMDLYSDNGYSANTISVLYSAAQDTGMHQAAEIILTNLHDVPVRTRLWNSDRN